MEKTQIFEINGESYKFSVPTMRTQIAVESNVANLTRGAAPFLAISSNPAAKTAHENVYKLSRLDALVIKQKRTASGLADDFSFSFFDLADDQQPLVDQINAKLEEFIASFRKKNS